MRGGAPGRASSDSGPARRPARSFGRPARSFAGRVARGGSFAPRCAVAMHETHCFAPAYSRMRPLRHNLRSRGEAAGRRAGNSPPPRPGVGLTTVRGGRGIVSRAWRKSPSRDADGPLNHAGNFGNFAALAPDSPIIHPDAGRRHVATAYRVLIVWCLRVDAGGLRRSCSCRGRSPAPGMIVVSGIRDFDRS